VSIRRGKGLVGAVKVELIVPAQVRGVSAGLVTLAADATKGNLSITFAARPGPFNQSATVRATLSTPRGPVVAEVPLELVAE
jgi:hypothetical protein